MSVSGGEERITRSRNTLESLLAQRSKIKVLRFLLESSEAVSGREMSRLTGLDHKTCHKALKELSQQGVVRVKNANHSNLYRLNPKSYLVNKIIFPLFERERSILNHFANGNGKKRPQKAASNNSRKGRNHHV